MVEPVKITVMDLLTGETMPLAEADKRREKTRDRITDKNHRISELTEAIWEYGQHRPNCRIKDGACCDCGFFEVIASLKDSGPDAARL